MSKKDSGKQWTFAGFTGNLTQWSKRLGVPRNTLRGRIAKWGTSKDALPLIFTAESQRWMRTARWITYKGRTMAIKDWAAEVGISPMALSIRLNRLGYTLEEALRKEPKYPEGSGLWNMLHGGRRVVIDGIEDNLAGHARRLGIPYSRVKGRLNPRKLGENQTPWDVEAALKTPPMDVEARLECCRRAHRDKWSRRQAAAMGIVM